MNYKLVIIALIYIGGLYFIIKNTTKQCIEGFEESNKSDVSRSVASNCPNLLIKKDTSYYLYNTTKTYVPGVNPIRFESLNEYTQFMDWMRGSGIHCPVLYLQQTNDTQGQRTYKILPDPDEPNAGLQPNYPQKVSKLVDAGHNKGSMPGFDPMNQYIGENTPLDQIFHEKQSQSVSDNPIDTNWGGAQYSQQQVDSGIYAGDKAQSPSYSANLI